MLFVSSQIRWDGKSLLFKCERNVMLQEGGRAGGGTDRAPPRSQALRGHPAVRPPPGGPREPRMTSSRPWVSAACSSLAPWVYHMQL